MQVTIQYDPADVKNAAKLKSLAQAVEILNANGHAASVEPPAEAGAPVKAGATAAKPNVVTTVPESVPRRGRGRPKAKPEEFDLDEVVTPPVLKAERAEAKEQAFDDFEDDVTFGGQDDDEPAFTAKQVFEAARSFANKHGKPKYMKILERLDVKRIGDLDAAHFGDAMKALSV